MISESKRTCIMALINPEDCTTESRYLYVSSLIIDEVLNNIASSSSPSSSTQHMECDAAKSSIGKLVRGCGRDEVTDTDKVVDIAKGLSVVKRVTFSEDVAIVSYEDASKGEDEMTDAQLVMMEDDGEKETVRITKKKDDLGSASVNGGDFSEKMSYCDADGILLKRKCSGSDWEDTCKCIIPNKMIRPEADSVISHQNEQDVNEDDVQQATGNHFLTDTSKKKVGTDKSDVEAILKVPESPDISVALTQDEEEYESSQTANRKASFSLCYPSDMDSTTTVQDNPIVHSLCQDDADADMNDSLPNEPPSEDIMDDCRSVLQAIVDNTLHQMVLNTKLDEDTESTPDTNAQPPLKKVKPTPPSDSDTTESFLSNSTVPGFQRNKEMEFYPNDIPKLSNTSTTDVEQLFISETRNVTACSMEAEVSCDNLSHDMCSGTERENFHRVPQVASESSGVSTSTEDVMEDKDEDGDHPMFKEAAEISPSPEAAVSCADLNRDLSSGRESANGYGGLQGASDSTGVSTCTSTPYVKEDEDEDKTTAMEEAEIPSPPCIPSPIKENEYLTSNNNFGRQDTPCLSTPDVDIVEDIQNITPRRENTAAMEAPETSSPPCLPSPLSENEYMTSNKKFNRQDTPCLSTQDVEEVEDIQNLAPREEPNAYSSILAQDLYLDDSVEYPDQSEVVQLGMHDDEECVVGTSVPSSADMEVVKPDDVYVDFIEPSFREDIMPSPESSDDDLGCTFQKASQVVTSSQSESHPLGKLDGLSPADIDLEITTDDLQVPTFVSKEPPGEELMNNAIGRDWKAKLTFPDTDNSKSKAPEVPVQDHLDIIQEQLNNHLPGKSKAKDTLSDIPEHQFLQVLGLSPEQRMAKSPEQRKPCQSVPNKAVLTHVVDSSIRGIEAKEENEPMLHPMHHGNLERPVEDSEVKSTKLSRIGAKGTNDQTVPSLQTSVNGDPCIDHLLELEESIFSEQDIKHLEGPRKQSILVLEEEPLIEDEEAKPVPDHLQTLGQYAAGVFQWKHSLSDPSLTPSPTIDQSTLQCTENRLDQSTPITPVRPLPACHRRRRVGLSRRQLVYPLHSKTFSGK